MGAHLLSASLGLSRRHGWLLIGAASALCWAITALLGGAAFVPAHYFYLPILFAGIRFGASGALVTACIAAVLAGPLTYADVATRTPQSFSDWGTRGLFFVVIGQALTAMATLAAAARQEELADVRAASALSSALDEQRFEVYFQTVVSMRPEGRIIGAEALLRLNEPDRGVVGPDEFIPDAERTGMIRPIGEFVLRDACRQVAAWRDEDLTGPEFTLSVNVSCRQLDAADFADRVADVLDATGLDPSWLQLEITETALALHPQQFIDSLHSLHRLGVSLALDDFGTGHSTLAEVQRLPVDVIKIDKQFVDSLGQRGSVIAENVVALAHSLELTAVAEGVETQRQAQLLGRLGCDAAQGYLYSRPVPGAEFALTLAAEDRPRADRPVDPAQPPRLRTSAE